MRDVNRMKEKYELSLDNRQIVSMTIGGLIVVGAIFVLGVVVGKKLAVDDHVAQAPDLLSALDQKAAALDTMQKDASLTFQDELTRKPAPIVEAKPIEPPRPELARPIEAPRPVEVAKPIEAPRPVEPPKPVEPAAVVAVSPPEPKPAEVARADAVPTRINQDAGALREAIARAQKPAGTAPDGAFTLQLSAYQDRAEADRFAANLRDKGYAPFIVEANLPGKGIWFRVRMGRFPSRDAAGRYLTDFKRETSIDAIVTAAN